MTKLESIIESLKGTAVKATGYAEVLNAVTVTFPAADVKQQLALAAKLMEHHYNTNGWPYGLDKKPNYDWYRHFANAAMSKNPELEINLRGRDCGYLEMFYYWQGELKFLVYYQSSSTDTSREVSASEIMSDLSDWRHKWVDHDSMKYIRDPDDAIFIARAEDYEKENAIKEIHAALRRLLCNGKLK